MAQALIRLAVPGDLPNLVRIYHQYLRTGHVTLDVRTMVCVDPPNPSRPHSTPGGASTAPAPVTK